MSASVVIPTRNRAAALERCLLSLVRQTQPADEVIVVDDGSTDDTPAMLDRLAERNPGLGLRVLRNDPQRGANPSRNRGVAEATGVIIVFTDDDCEADAGWLAHLTARFADDRVGAVTGRVENVPARNIYELTWKGTQRVHSPDGVRASRLVGCNMAVRRELLLEHGLDEDRAEPSPDVRVSGRGDEEGLSLRLQRAGWEQRFAPEAVVVHDHPHTAGTLLRQAYRGGRAAAKLVYKYRLLPRLDLLPFMLLYATLPLIALDLRL
ncbi:MAG: glycosyltransferase family 2 protein, partial [Planctomycetota bacterium]